MRRHVFSPVLLNLPVGSLLAAVCVPTRRTIARSYAFWLPLHFITYGAMPARHRLVWVSFCSIGFATLLSWCMSEGEAGTDAGGDAVVATLWWWVNQVT